jgi:cephalosporin hydroxylase
MHYGINQLMDKLGRLHHLWERAQDIVYKVYYMSNMVIYIYKCKSQNLAIGQYNIYIIQPNLAVIAYGVCCATSTVLRRSL